MDMVVMVIYCQTTKMAIMSYFHQNFPKYRKYANSSSLGTSNKPWSGSHTATDFWKIAYTKIETKSPKIVRIQNVDSSKLAL